MPYIIPFFLGKIKKKKKKLQKYVTFEGHPEVAIGINGTPENESKLVPSSCKPKQAGINCKTLDVHESGTTTTFF